MFYVVWENESVSESCVDINEWKKTRNLECFGERDLQINIDNVLITCLICLEYVNHMLISYSYGRLTCASKSNFHWCHFIPVN